MNHLVIPQEQELAHSLTVELSETGGHVGFMQGTPTAPEVWMHQRVLRYFRDYLPTITESA